MNTTVENDVRVQKDMFRAKVLKALEYINRNYGAGNVVDVSFKNSTVTIRRGWGCSIVDVLNFKLLTICNKQYVRFRSHTKRVI